MLHKRCFLVILQWHFELILLKVKLIVIRIDLKDCVTTGPEQKLGIFPLIFLSRPI